METRVKTGAGAVADWMFEAPLSGSQAQGQPHPAARPAPGPAHRPAEAAKTILVVDDNKDYRVLVRHFLSVNHFNVLEAGDGREALDVINRGNPDLVLVDFNMPRMNGYELIQEIRSNYETHGMRIIMFTGATNRQQLRSLNMDISEFLEKPVSNAKLLESIQKAFGGRAYPYLNSPPAPKPAPAAEHPEPEPPMITIERFERAAEERAAQAPAPKPQIELPQDAFLPQAAAAAPGPAQPRSAPAETPQDALLRAAPASPAAAPALPELPPEEAPAEPAASAEEAPEMEMMFGENEEELELLESGAPRKNSPQEAEGLENLASDSPLIQRVNKILMAAVEMRASDIHIEPFEDKVIVRVRVDGMLKQLTTLPISIHPRLAARIKIMSSLVITEKRLPQDGQFRVQIRGQKIEFRVSTLPCIKGEKIVMRILGQSKLNSSISQLNLTPREHTAVEGALKSPNGLILVTGPTGSGKTTTLYTMINVLNKPDVNIMTAEDPVEYEVPNVNQVKILSGIGLTFESTLRAFLRQDPDIMLVGEIRDLETAEIAIKASITGHLVFSTLHTNSAPATVVRLTHMGVAPYLVAASVKMVAAQRLIRKLCDKCKVPGRLTDEEKKFLTEEEIASLPVVYHPGSCQACNHGFSGRKAVFEIMPVVSSEMRQLITTGRDVDALTALAVKEGMTTLRQSALNAVRLGETSVGEALKVIMG